MGGVQPSLFLTDGSDRLFNRRQKTSPVLDALGQHEGGNPPVTPGEHALVSGAVSGAGRYSGDADS